MSIQFKSIVELRAMLDEKSISTSELIQESFELAKKYFPKWIGFESSRCSFDAERSDRIKRIRKVSDWKIDKIINDSSEDIE